MEGENGLITAPLTGNFGNQQIFYAFARSIAEEKGYKFGFNPTPSHDYYGGKQQMDFMEIDYGVVHNAPFGQKPKGIENVWKEKYVDITD